MLIKAMGNDDFFLVDTDLQDFTSKKPDMAKHLAHGIHDRGEVQVASRNFVKHRREQKKVIPIDEGDLDGGIPSYSLLKVHGDGETRKTTAKNKYLFSYRAAHPSFLRLVSESSIHYIERWQRCVSSSVETLVTLLSIRDP